MKHENYDHNVVMKKIQFAAIYPTVVILMAVAALGLFSWKVVPKMAVGYESMGVSMPLVTKVLVNA